MATERQPWRPDWVVAPGEILQEAIEDRGISQSDLARRMGRPTKTINEIINGKAAITPDTAIQLELTLGIDASFWNNLETLYREQLARQRARQELEGSAAWAQKFPVRDLIRHGLIRESSTKGEMVEELLKFFGVGSPTGWEKKWSARAASFRRSPAFQSSDEATAAWIRWGEILALEVETELFDAKKLQEVMREVRGLTRNGDFTEAVDQARTLLATTGVALVLIPELKDIHASGAAYWIAPGKAVIQLSMRYKTSDQFWFSLFHEVGHLLLGKRADYVDSVQPEDGGDPDERMADEYARDALIPATDYAEYVAQGSFGESSVREFARQQGVATGIVVGRLQRDRHLDRSHLNNLKKQVGWSGRS